MDSMELITTAFRRMLTKKDSVFQENFRRTQMYNFYGDIILKGIQCFNYEHGFVPWQHGKSILKELKSVITETLKSFIHIRLQRSTYVHFMCTD